MNKHAKNALLAASLATLSWAALAQTATQSGTTTGTGTTAGVTATGTATGARTTTTTTATGAATGTATGAAATVPGVFPVPAQVDAYFMMAAAMSNYFEIQSSQVALQRSQNASVRQYAQRMIANHTTMQQSLSRLASQKGVSLPRETGDPQKVTIVRLTGLSGAAFDRAYLAAQSIGHTLTAAFHVDYIAVARDEQAKALASQALPMVREHLRDANALIRNVR